MYESVRTKFYNLDAIISVGYRVNSIQDKEYQSDFDKLQNEISVK
ncbi:MAG: virulence RhuM family protein [Lachnospiraceae bacterium]|nr:virulence RhuM family protein [Lachnospiraceae bacterium]